MKNNGCVGCHQIGQLATRTFPKAFLTRWVSSATPVEDLVRRIQSGQSGESMFNTLVTQLGAAPMEYFADWTDRVAKGELPRRQTNTAARNRTEYRRDHMGPA